jgi:hypothetical protein
MVENGEIFGVRCNSPQSNYSALSLHEFCICSRFHTLRRCADTIWIHIVDVIDENGDNTIILLTHSTNEERSETDEGKMKNKSKDQCQ